MQVFYTIALEDNMRVACIGAGTHLVSVLDSIKEDIQIVGVFDDLLENGNFHGIPQLGSLFEFPKYQEQYDRVIITIGDILLRERLLSLVKEHSIPQYTVIDSSAVVSQNACIEEGTFVGKRVIVNAEAKVGKACILNSGCIIEHGCVLEENIHIAPGAVLCGNVHVSKDTLVGANSTVIQSLSIASHTVVGAGACVCKNISKAGIYVGVPAKEMK